MQDGATETKLLFVVRHSEAEPDNPKGDAHRELTEQGHAVAAELGKALRTEGASPDAIFCSSATRATQTMQVINELMGVTAKPVVSEEYYRCFASGWVNALVGLEPSISQAMLIGHMPVLPTMIAELTGDKVSMRPGEACLLEFNGDWSALPGCSVSLKKKFPGDSS